MHWVVAPTIYFAGQMAKQIALLAGKECLGATVMPGNRGKYKVGDWVAFMRNGQLLHAQVMYVEEDGVGKQHLATTNGSVSGTSVLECRRSGNAG